MIFYVASEANCNLSRSCKRFYCKICIGKSFHRLSMQCSQFALKVQCLVKVQGCIALAEMLLKCFYFFTKSCQECLPKQFDLFIQYNIFLPVYLHAPFNVPSMFPSDKDVICDFVESQEPILRDGLGRPSLFSFFSSPKIDLSKKKKNLS